MTPKTLMALCAALASLALGVLPAQALRDAISERENFKGRDVYNAQSGFQLTDKNGALAQVVLPESPLPVQEFAAQELIEHVFKATGARLPLVRENQLKNEGGARIYVGGVRALKTIGARGVAGFDDVTWLPAGGIAAVAPDTVRQAKDVAEPLWVADNRPGAGGQRDDQIEIVLDLGQKKRVAALAVKNRADTATNYNIGRVQIAVGEADDGRQFERAVTSTTPAPAPSSNAAAAVRWLILPEPVEARYFRLRLTSNLFGEMNSKASGNIAVWSGLGYATASASSAADSKLLDLESLPPNGFLIQTQSDALFLAGHDENGAPLANNTLAGTLFAVYEWLERQAGVRWIWPGELGTQVPKAGVLRSGTWDVLAQPPLLHANWRQSVGRSLWIPSAGGFTPEQRAKVVQEEVLWARRARLARGVSFGYGHAYTEYWARFHDSHPEYFNLLPDGTRRSDPLYHGGQGRLISMSVGEAAFQQQVIEDWKTRRNAVLPWINGWENDTQGKCVGPECLALDARDPALSDEQWTHRVENARRAFEAKESDWVKHLGSLSDRYARYYLALQQRGRAIDPTATVIGGAYANYAKAPLQTKLNRNIVIGIVPAYGWPASDATFAGFQEQWGGWHEAGASLYLRPNYTLWGGEQPIIMARDWARDFQFAYERGMIGTDYDSLTSMWATQGPNIYVLSRLHTHPDWPVEKLLDEYYDAFGAGRAGVQKYFEYWEAQTQRAAKEMAQMKAQADGAQLFSGWAGLHQVIGKIYTPENYAAAARFLEAAHAATQSDKTAQQRVEFLQAGLEDARLVAKTSLASDEFKRTAKDEKLIAAIGELDRHRARMAVQFPNALNLDLAAWMENRDWNRALYSAIGAALQDGEIVTELPREWRLRWDENKSGQRENWSQHPGEEALWHPVRVDAPWEAQKVGQDWKAAHSKDYDGWAWYRVRFKVDPQWKGKKLALLFGAVDEAATVYLNGQKAGEHPFVHPNDWQTPFQIDVTNQVNFGGENELLVLVEDNAGAGGVWKPVWLVAPR